MLGIGNNNSFDLNLPFESLIKLIRNFFKIKLKRTGIRKQMGIEVNDDAWASKSIHTKLDGSGDNNIFFGKVKN